jgi:uncharacterized protein YjbI with pentapeptide repeats
MFKNIPSFAAAAILLAICANAARADIFQWEYIDPANLSSGKQQSSTLVPDGAGVDAVSSANLALRNLAMAYLIEKDLRHAFLRSSNFTNADFSRADLTYAALDNSNFTTANFGQTKLFYAQLTGSHLNGADLSPADLTYANLTSASLTGANYTGAKFSNSSLE